MTAQRANEPKNHHYLPQSYQRAWCSNSGTVTVRRRGSQRTFDTGTVAVGAELHLYGKGIEALWREKNFGLLESKWPALRTELITTGNVHGQNRSTVATFRALQVARTREHLTRTTVSAQLAEFTGERPISKDKVREFIKIRLRHDPDDTEVDAAWSLVNYELTFGQPTVDEAFSISMDVAVRQMAPLFENLNWRVETVDQPVLWTSDRPVMPWRTPTERDSFEGSAMGSRPRSACRSARPPCSSRSGSIRVARSPYRCPGSTTTTGTSHGSAMNSSCACRDVVPACGSSRSLTAGLPFDSTSALGSRWHATALRRKQTTSCILGSRYATAVSRTRSRRDVVPGRRGRGLLVDPMTCT